MMTGILLQKSVSFERLKYFESLGCVVKCSILRDELNHQTKKGGFKEAWMRVCILIFCNTARRVFTAYSVSRELPIKVGLGISRTNADSQWNPVYNVFHRNFCCGNETSRR